LRIQQLAGNITFQGSSIKVVYQVFQGRVHFKVEQVRKSYKYTTVDFVIYVGAEKVCVTHHMTKQPCEAGLKERK